MVSTTIDRRGEVAVAPTRRWVTVALMVVTGAVAGFLATSPGPASLVAGALVGGLVGFAMLWLALTRFEDYLVVLFVLRASVDYVKGDSGGISSPTSLLGLSFLVLGGGWLWIESRRRALVQPSVFAMAVWGLTGLTLLSPLFASHRLGAVSSAARVVSFAVMFTVLEQVFRRDPAFRVRMLKAVLLSVVLPALASILQLLGYGAVHDEFVAVTRVRGTFVHPNPFATYLVMIIVLALALRSVVVGWQRSLLSLATLVASACLLFTYSRGAWVAAIIGVAIVAVERDRRLFALFLAGGVALVLLVPSVVTRLSDLGEQNSAGAGDPNSLAWRLGYWEDLIPLGLRAPVGGIGLDGARLTNVDQLQPHNVFVQSFVELGLPGFLTLLFVLLAAANSLIVARFYARDAFERALGTAALAIALGILLQLFSENLLTQAVTLWYLAVILAAACANGWSPGGVAPAPRERPAWLLVRQLLDERRVPRRPVAEPHEVRDLAERVRAVQQRNQTRSFLIRGDDDPDG